MEQPLASSSEGNHTVTFDPDSYYIATARPSVIDAVASSAIRQPPNRRQTTALIRQAGAGSAILGSASTRQARSTITGQAADASGVAWRSFSPEPEFGSAPTLPSTACLPLAQVLSPHQKPHSGMGEARSLYSALVHTKRRRTKRNSRVVLKASLVSSRQSPKAPVPAYISRDSPPAISYGCCV